MKLDKFTIKGQEALLAAQQQAETYEHPQLEPEHLLEALLSQKEGIVAPIMKKLGVAPETLLAELHKHFSLQPRVQGGQVAISPRLDSVMRQAQKEADQFKDEYISTEHLLLALAQESCFTGTEPTAVPSCRSCSRFAAVPGSPIRMPRTSIRRSSDTPVISRILPVAANWILSSDGMMRSDAWFRFFRGAQKTTRY
jgi:hypothetical protein